MGAHLPTITGSPIQTPASSPTREDRLSGAPTPPRLLWRIHWGSRPSNRRVSSLRTWPETRAVLALPEGIDVDRGYWRLPCYLRWPWLHVGGTPTPTEPVWMGLVSTQVLGSYRPRVTLAFPGWFKNHIHRINPALPHLLGPRITPGWLPGGGIDRHFCVYLPIPEPPKCRTDANSS